MCTRIEDSNICFPLTSNQRRKKGCRGIGLAIVNHFNEFPEFMREGTLSQLFASLNLKFRPHTELTKEQIVELLKRTARDPVLSSDSMIAIAISSHGCEEGLLGINIGERSKHINDPNYTNMDGCIPPKLIQEIFSGENCNGLAGKPKLFLLNGCRGGGIEKMVRKKRKEIRETLSADVLSSSAFPEKDIATTWSDFFVVHSCVSGNISLRSSTLGSLFLVEFYKAYVEYGHRFPIESIVPTVNQNLIDYCRTRDVKSIQCCTWESTCTRSLFIPPTCVRFEPIQKKAFIMPQTNMDCLPPPIAPNLFIKARNDDTVKRSAVNKFTLIQNHLQMEYPRTRKN